MADGEEGQGARARGADVPDFLAAGPRDIFVLASAAEVAGEALAPQPNEEPS
jgi:hypothetical protein